LLEHEEQEDGKGQWASAGESFGPDAMTRLEIGRAQAVAQCFDEGEQITGNGRLDRSHPHANTGNICLVRALLLKINDLHANSTAVQPGPLPLGEGEIQAVAGGSGAPGMCKR
jgi:hypothetical protein